MVRTASHGGRPSATASAPVLGVVAGLLAGAVAAVVVATATGAPHAGPAVKSSGPPPSAAPAYLAAWRRSQLGTWRVVLRWERRTAGGVLDDEVRIAQRPPDRLAVAAGTVDARRDDRRLACAAAEDGHLLCRDAGPAPSYAEEVDRQESILRAQMSGPQALYDVSTAAAGCYDLRLRFPSFPAPPYGRTARFCFDRATGAPTLLDIDRREGRDRQVAIELSAEVKDGDLAPPISPLR